MDTKAAAVKRCQSCPKEPTKLDRRIVSGATDSCPPR